MVVGDPICMGVECHIRDRAVTDHQWQVDSTDSRWQVESTDSRAGGLSIVLQMCFTQLSLILWCCDSRCTLSKDQSHWVKF